MLKGAVCKFVMIIFATCNVQMSAQNLLDSLFSKETLLEDLDSLHQTILSSHPNPYAFCGQAAFENAFQESKSQIDSTGLSLRNFTEVAACFMAVMADSHTSLDYGQLLDLQLENKGLVLPMSLSRVANNKYGRGYEFIVRHDWENKIPSGSMLISINDQDAQSLYQQALNYSCIEGDAVEAKDAVATAILPVTSGLLQPATDVNYINIIPYGSDTARTITLPGYNKKQYVRKRAERSKLKENQYLNIEYDYESSLAVLKVGTFAPPNTKYYRKFIRKAFIEIEKRDIESVAIDIRNNGGGSSGWVEYLYSFLDSAGYSTPSNVIGKNSHLAMRRARLFNTGLARIIIKLFYKHDEDVQSFKHFASLAWGDMDTIYFHEATRQKSRYVFTGECFLLINGLTASAGVDFTNAFRKHNRGLIVGSPCLGPVTGTWGNPARYKLPATGLLVSVATIRYNYDNSFKYERRAIEPNYLVPDSMDDIHLDVDTQIEFIKNRLAPN